MWAKQGVCLEKKKHISTFAPNLLPSQFLFLPPSGAAIITATAIQDFYAILGAFGIGFDVANIVGVMVTTHVAANQVGQ